jgi:hypothetical protein
MQKPEIAFIPKSIKGQLYKFKCRIGLQPTIYKTRGGLRFAQRRSNQLIDKLLMNWVLVL